MGLFSTQGTSTPSTTRPPPSQPRRGIWSVSTKSWRSERVSVSQPGGSLPRMTFRGGGAVASYLEKAFIDRGKRSTPVFWGVTCWSSSCSQAGSRETGSGSSTTTASGGTAASSRGAGPPAISSSAAAASLAASSMPALGSDSSSSSSSDALGGASQGSRRVFMIWSRDHWSFVRVAHVPLRVCTWLQAVSYSSMMGPAMRFASLRVHLNSLTSSTGPPPSLPAKSRVWSDNFRPAPASTVPRVVR
mmetsp:Transcript_31325/g.106198  ORF Transcript_31325/g.106198 Transcript_31325/m.106198 type:complete len:246 (-) Transcript_31325:170-907(-)